LKSFNSNNTCYRKIRSTVTCADSQITYFCKERPSVIETN